MRLARVCAASLLLAASARGADDRPSFVVVLCDDLGYGDVGFLGSEAIRTPHLDALAAEGLTLRACYAAAPVCSPSRAGLLTGRDPNRAGVYDWIPRGHPMHLPAGERTLATLLRDAGYDTCHSGKWHLNGSLAGDQPQPGDHGFDHWFATQNNAAPSHANPTNFVRNGEPAGSLSGYSCQLVVDEALAWLADGRDATRPFFLLVAFHEPHEPIASPPALVATYPEADEPGEAEYQANVTNMDRAVGRLTGGLDALGLSERTLVVFTSDNGPEGLNRYRGAERSHGSPGPLRGRKLHLFEGGVRVPGLVRWPGVVAAGTRTEVPVSSLDLLPTFASLAGVELPADLRPDGEDVGALLRGEPFARTTPLFWMYFRALGGPHVALRDGDWKLVARLAAPGKRSGKPFGPGDRRWIEAAEPTGFELFHLGRDLAERSDLSADEPQRLAELSARLERALDDVRHGGPDWFGGQ